jgi:ERCC4-type nuclease
MDIAHETGSSEFERPLRRLGLEVRVRNLTSADFAFYGQGPDGECRVGVERKTVQEMVGLASRRRLTGHQLPRMTLRYRFRFLLIEGHTRVNSSWGNLEMSKPAKGGRVSVWFPAGWGKERDTFETYFKHNLTLRLKGAMILIPTADKTETAHALHALYRWFQKDWKDHTSHLTIDEVLPDQAIIDERTVRRQLLAQVPHLGWTYSAKVSKQLNHQTLAETLAWMAGASVKDWQRVLGFKEGMAIAQSIHRVLHAPADTRAKA